ncbi:NADP-dependent oxidoreductase [Kitasatospora paracochleata]|uniref:NADPH2:quinone reductase n=1 Tax=Kitasatospora paracochleata TaxID=58354 RepID=A0ABT1IU10_9ACTN|nr:NADP-dependent oxidoreductase [Kitasatospora paracochleata]MCP2308625.1 NADPH2:quinone reductase [Kitasatospora paracochleata]
MSKAFGFVAYGGPENQEFLDRPAPEPGPGTLLIAVRAAGVNPADWKKRRGMFGTGDDLPAVLGSEAAGVVRAVGPGVSGFAVGDAVFGTTPVGAFAEHTLLAAEGAAHKPGGVTFAQAAALPVAAATAYDAVRQLDLDPGRTLLILGIAGGVGSAAAQLAREQGLRVLGTAGEHSRAHVEALGATPVRYGEGVGERVAAAAPDGVDGILDLVGGEAVRAVAGVLTDRSKLVSTVDPATAEELGGGYVRRDGTGAVLTVLADLVAAGKFDPQITATYPLAHAAEAMAAVESGHARGKLILEVS